MRSRIKVDPGFFFWSCFAGGIKRNVLQAVRLSVNKLPQRQSQESQRDHSEDRKYFLRFHTFLDRSSWIIDRYSIKLNCYYLCRQLTSYITTIYLTLFTFLRSCRWMALGHCHHHQKPLCTNQRTTIAMRLLISDLFLYFASTSTGWCGITLKNSTTSDSMTQSKVKVSVGGQEMTNSYSIWTYLVTGIRTTKKR